MPGILRQYYLFFASVSVSLLNRYRPSDWKPNEAQNHIAAVQKKNAHDQEKQVEAFLKVRENFKPVMRHYFTEKHKTPITWFQMRLHYTRSVATNSIVGHILGLGDRHTSNILLDNATGEVVHIDLGIAFDQVGTLFRDLRNGLTVFLGQASGSSREGAIPYDCGCRRRDGPIWHLWGISEVRRGDASRPPR